ncbi:MAG: hypothetical protein FRX49_10798 [Trebouxia sp. A1-2]|nr:MAG: hypothetical protein FRX49_10798 [Trebouxia sp. A1-2]
MELKGQGVGWAQAARGRKGWVGMSPVRMGLSAPPVLCILAVSITLPMALRLPSGAAATMPLLPALPLLLRLATNSSRSASTAVRQHNKWLLRPTNTVPDWFISATYCAGAAVAVSNMVCTKAAGVGASLGTHSLQTTYLKFEPTYGSQSMFTHLLTTDIPMPQSQQQQCFCRSLILPQQDGQSLATAQEADLFHLDIKLSQGQFGNLREPGAMTVYVQVHGEASSGTKSDLLRKSTDGTMLLLELSVMLRTSTWTPKLHIKVFTAYLQMAQEDESVTDLCRKGDSRNNGADRHIHNSEVSHGLLRGGGCCDPPKKEEG